MNGNGVFESLGSGIATGIFGLAVAEVGGGGRARKSGSRPGIKSVTTFCTARAFLAGVGKRGGRRERTYLDLDPVGWWRVCDDVKDEITHVLRDDHDTTWTVSDTLTSI